MWRRQCKRYLLEHPSTIWLGLPVASNGNASSLASPGKNTGSDGPFATRRQKPRLSGNGRQDGGSCDEEAIDHRFTDELVLFLEAILQQAVSQALAAKAAATPLLQTFSDVRIGDSTSLMLPDEFADRFPGCGGTENACRAAMKIQVLWSLLTGQLLGWQITPGRASDAKSEIAEVLPPAGSLSVFDLGYFSLDRFRRVSEADAYWVSRLQHGTKVFDAAGNSLDLPSFCGNRAKTAWWTFRFCWARRNGLPAD